MFEVTFMLEEYFLLKNMEYVFLHPEDEKNTEGYMRKKFGKHYLIFSEFCLGGGIPYAHYIGQGRLKLTQEGVREYHRLKRDFDQRIFNLIVTIATVIVAIFSTLNFLFK